MRREPTDAERKVWSIVRARRLGAKFRRQEQIGDYIVDFVCFEARLIVEADGSQHADSVTDARRTPWLEAQGFRILRFWNNDILHNPESVARTILAALNSSLPVGEDKEAPSPSDLAQLGEEQ